MPDKNSTSNARPSWIVVYTALGMSEAHLIANRLKSEGIPAFVSQDSLAGVLGINVGIGEIFVLVREADYDDALSLLEPDNVEQLPASRDYIIVDSDEDDEDS